MRGRAGVVAFVVALFAAGVAAGAIQAGSPLSLTTTSDTTTTTPATTDVTTQPATTAATTTTTTAATTTTAPTTTTVAPPPKPRPAANPAGRLLTATPLGTPRCAVLAGFALLEPGRSPMTLGDVAVLPRARNVSQIGVAYPANGSVLTASSVSLRGSGCGPSARGNAHVGSLSLFGGALTVQGVELGVSKGSAGTGASVTGLSVGTAPVAATPGRPIVIGSWGYVVALAQPDRTQAGALAVHLTRAHAGLPSGTVLLVGFAQLAPSDVKTQAARPAPAKAPTAKTRAQPKLKQQRPQVVQRPKKVTKPTKPKRRKRKHHLGDDPLKLTPRLGLSNYVFPVAGVSSYIDTYGGYRGDVPGNWHHGEDIFASLGTPVVAVADGTLNRVGWEHLGGWRLWVRDHNRNQFYYAHLSGYSPLALHSKFVKKGDVLGFVGNSGDAFTTPPHVHFEIHPHQLLQLDYNGAVDPTSYIDGWRHLTKPNAPLPVHPPFPAGPVRREASYIWRELLAARGLIDKSPKRSERPRIAVPHGDVGSSSLRRLTAAKPREATASIRAGQTGGAIPLADLLAGIVLPAVLFAGALAYRLRRERLAS